MGDQDIQIDSQYLSEDEEYYEANAKKLEDEIKANDVENVPALGMVFETELDAYDFYNSYARRLGFSVKRKRVDRNKRTKVVISRQYSCSCEGFYSKKSSPMKQRDVRRFGCEATLEIKLNQYGKFFVSKFIVEHTHDLVPPSHVHLLRSQREIHPSQAGLITKMHEAGLKQSAIYRYLSTEVGGPQHLNFIQTDCNNFVQRSRAEFLKKGDAQCLLEYFKKKQKENKSFFYAIRTNIENEITGCFFCDAKSRHDYGIYGDVICFDTTFNTNKYNMLCAPIIGINSHGQTTLFGCGIIDGETIDGCVWLFNSFLEAMGGKRPETIFTDQAAAISSAIEEVFPEVHHRLCLWHIYQNAGKNLSQVYGEAKEFKKQFKSCIYDPESIEEFDLMWDNLLDTYNLRDHEWLKKLFTDREKWAQVYARSHFCAGMTTTQRSESINKLLKNYFARNLILREFVDQYDNAVTNRREKERIAEMHTHQTRPELLGDWNVMKEASMKYTRKVFNLFRVEYGKIVDWSLKFETGDEATLRCTVLKLGTHQKRLVTYDPNSEVINCSCRKFEFEGILCSHSLKLLRELDLKTLPPQYYLKRWCRDAKDEIVYDPFGEVLLCDPNPSYLARYSELSHLSQSLVVEGARDENSYILAKSILEEAKEKLRSHAVIEQERDETCDDIDLTNEPEESNVNFVLEDPKVIKSKGRGKSRMKNALEIKPPKKKGTSKRKDSNGNNVETFVGGPPNLYAQVQGSMGQPYQFPTCHDAHPPYGFSLNHGAYDISNQPMYAVVPPNGYYPVMHSQEVIHQRIEERVHHPNFQDSSTSGAQDTHAEFGTFTFNGARFN